MVTNISYNVIIDRLKAFATGHFLIKHFSHGQIDLRYLEKDADYYPWMHVIPGTINPAEGLREYSFDITFSDLTRDKEHESEYIREAISDCTRLAEDLLAEIKNGNTLFDSSVQIVDGSSITPFIHEDTHTLTGVTLSLSIRVPWDWSACDIPADYAPGGSSSGGGAFGGCCVTLQVNSTDNVDQSLLNLVEGENITLTDNGDGSVTIDSTGGGGGVGTLQEVTDLGNTTTNDIEFGAGAGVYFNNGARVTEGTTNSGLGGNGGVALKCSVDYELKWEAGRLYVMQQDGFTIREVLYNLTATPTVNDDDTKGFVVGSRWTLDDGSVYECTNNTTGAAVWNLIFVPDITGLVPYTGATNDVAIGNHNITADDGSFNSAMQPSLFGVENAAATEYATLEYNALSVVNSNTGDTTQITPTGINFPDATTQSTAAIPQVNSDWDAVSGVAEILNKPTIPAAQVNSDWDAVSGVEEILNKPTLATVATTGDYADLINQPFIPTNLDDLADVNAPTPSNGQVLTYNTTSGDWEAVTPTGLSPLTTKGDLYTYSTNNARLPVGTNGQVLLADSSTATGLKWGTNTLPPASGYYAMYQDVLTQTVATINTGYPIKFRTMDLSNGVTVVSNSRITFANTGVYNLQFSVQLENSDTQEHDVTIWLRKNGVDFPGSAGFVAVVSKHGGINGHVLPSWNYLLDVVGGDYYELVWSATSTQVTMPFIAAGSPPPSTASAIFTVTQQAGILAGTGVTAINSLTGAVQTIGVGTSGTDFAVSSSGTAHTFNLPTASASNRGALSSADWSTFNGKQNSVGFTTVGNNIATLANPSAITYLKIAADNTVSAITAAQLKTDLGIPSGTMFRLIKTADQAITASNTTAVDITDLTFPITSGKKYRIRAFLIHSGNPSAGLKFGVNANVAVTSVYQYNVFVTGTTNNAISILSGNTLGVLPFTAGVSALLLMSNIECIIDANNTGTAAIQFAKSVATGGTLTIKAGSIVEYYEY